MVFLFLDLPPEIREKIYLVICTSSYPIAITGESDLLIYFSDDVNLPRPGLFPHALLLTCHQIYHEVRPLYFTHNSFSLLLLRDPSPLSFFLSPSFHDNRLQIKSFRLVISRWGQRDFFLKQFAPLVSDMILNGNLRKLEVWVRKEHLLLPEKGELNQVETVEKLMEILKDPYLVKVVLKAYTEKIKCNPRLRKNMLRGKGTVIELEDVSNLIERPRQVVKW